jgi:hypothetical protein
VRPHDLVVGTGSAGPDEVGGRISRITTATRNQFVGLEVEVGSPACATIVAPILQLWCHSLCPPGLSAILDDQSHVGGPDCPRSPDR